MKPISSMSLALIASVPVMTARTAARVTIETTSPLGAAISGPGAYRLAASQPPPLDQASFNSECRDIIALAFRQAAAGTDTMFNLSKMARQLRMGGSSTSWLWSRNACHELVTARVCRPQRE